MGGRRQTAQGDDARRPHISDSISDNKFPRSEAEPRVVEESEKPQRQTYEERVGYPSSRVKPIRSLGEEIGGKRYTNPFAQEKCIATMLQTGYSEEEIMSCFRELLEDEFWSSRGVDFKTVLSQIGKAKRKKITHKNYNDV